MAKDPICGMFVEEGSHALTATLHGTRYFFCSETCLTQFQAPEKALTRLKQLVLVGTVLTVPITALTYLPLIPSKDINNLVMFLLSVPVQFVVGFRFYRGSYDALRSRIGNILERLTKQRASESVRKLLELQPTMATVIRDGGEVDIPIEDVRVDDLFVVRPGERVPIDGVVAEGSSALDESMITGESLPRDKSVGDEVIGSTINKTGLLKVRATKVGQDTVLSQIVKLVEEAQVGKAPLQRLADRVSAYFVPSVILIATASGLLWYFVGRIGLAYSLLAFVSVIIIACPCALGLATPAALLVGTGKGAESGILIKGGENLEEAHKVDTIVFDKTGTLTKGEPSVTDIVPLSGKSAKTILHFAGSAEIGSEHPLAQAVVREAWKLQSDPSSPSGFEALPGLGIRAEVDDRRVLLGNADLMRKFSVPVESYSEQLEPLQNYGKTAVFLAVDGEPWAILGLADTLKETSVSAIRILKSMGLNVIMLTGDNERTAEAIASSLNLDQVIANVRPDEKEKGGIILIKDDLRDVVKALQLSKATVRKIKENLLWAFLYNIALIPIAAGVLVPFLGPGIYNVLPLLAGAAMAFSSVTVVSNSLLLRRFTPKL